MNHRGLATVSTVAVLVLLAPAFVLAQLAQSTPRTQWGAADLRGVWNNSTLTPFQRPAELGDREFLTDEEAASIEQRTADRNRDLANRGALRTVADPNASVDRGVDGAPGSYNNFWMERGTTVVSTKRTSIIVDPPNGRLPAVTPKTRKWLASAEANRLADVRGGRLPTDTYEQLDLGDRCIWYRGIPSFPTAYNNNYQIFQTPDYLVLVMEMIHEARIIPLDGRPHAADGIRQWLGDGRGHWEGDTLVVETIHFNDRLDGGDGTDRLYERSNVDMTLTDASLSGGLGSDALTSIETAYLKGGNSNNRLDASAFSGDVTLIGVGGADTLKGGSGNDMLNGRSGADSITGGDGDDTLKGLRDNDTLNGGAGNDWLDGGTQDDRISGWTGDDILYGRSGNDILVGGDGNDSLYGASGYDILQGDDGKADTSHSRDDDRLDGGTDGDTVRGGGGSDTMLDDASEVDENFAYWAEWVDAV